MTSKYENLEIFLKNQKKTEDSISLSFKEIDQILGSPLPRSAYTHQAWWANQKDVSNRPQAKSWINSGFIVDSFLQRSNTGSVVFRRKYSGI